MMGGLSHLLASPKACPPRSFRPSMRCSFTIRFSALGALGKVLAKRPPGWNAETGVSELSIWCVNMYTYFYWLYTCLTCGEGGYIARQEISTVGGSWFWGLPGWCFCWWAWRQRWKLCLWLWKQKTHAAEMGNEKSSHYGQTLSLVHFFCRYIFPTNHVAMKCPLGSLPGRWLLHRGFSHAHRSNHDLGLSRGHSDG